MPDSSPSIPLRLDLSSVDPRLLDEARDIWRGRLRSEYQSIQIFTRLLSETLAIGESLDVQRTICEMVEEEISHADLCGKVCAALGGPVPELKDVALPHPDLRDVPDGERALASAISMLLINETFSVDYITDLAARCDHPEIGAVLGSICGEEEGHRDFGVRLTGALLEREPASQRPHWRRFARRLVAQHLDRADTAIRAAGDACPTLEELVEPQLARLGLISSLRLALICRRTWNTSLKATLESLGLWDDRDST